MAISEPAARLLQKIAAEQRSRTGKRGEGTMASIKRFHLGNGCNGQNCECARGASDYRPARSFRVLRKRIEFLTKKAGFPKDIISPPRRTKCSRGE